MSGAATGRGGGGGTFTIDGNRAPCAVIEADAPEAAEGKEAGKESTRAASLRAELEMLAAMPTRPVPVEVPATAARSSSAEPPARRNWRAVASRARALSSEVCGGGAGAVVLAAAA